jgi:hypothetical protein
MAAKRKKKPTLRFDKKLVLNQWLLSLFGVERFEQLAEHLRDEVLEGVDENNIHRFHHALCQHIDSGVRPELTDTLLLEYDQNIVKHSQQLNEKRRRQGEHPIEWKYFQYLALLFVEIYLDRYFVDIDSLRSSINNSIEQFNGAHEEADHLPLYDRDRDAHTQLNKLTMWMATGSGKTLLMHANILQYRFYIKKHGRARDLNRTVLLTPNEGLSEQHLREFAVAGISAELFRKEASALFAGHTVEILDVHKLRDETGEKTIAVSAFEGNNLVLVDEGHRGVSSGETGQWMRRREELCENGFSFEYSATFGQAVKGNPKLTELYSLSTLFDYSYRYFYGDGFGKDYQILNLDDDTESEHRDLYLTACLLVFFQQLRLFANEQTAFRPFQLKKPLWIFVGGRVTKTLVTRDASDIIEILQFLERFVSQRRESIDRIGQVLNHGLQTASGKNLFSGRFAHLNTESLTSEQVFEETLEKLFNAPGGGKLYVENLKGASGEVALRIGSGNDPFGVINVGDDNKLVKLCKENGIESEDLEFAGSLFHQINQSDSTVNVLIGSKKFTEGWSSWRVSTMGLMNVGRTEGAQIIQLFGRGVRLQGHQWCLKRSARAPLPDRVEAPKHVEILETLSIFGIRADYMAQFRDFLKDEGLPGNEERIEMFLPVIRDLGKHPLKTIQLKKSIRGISTEFGDAFRKLGPIPSLGQIPFSMGRNKVVLNWYPKVKAIKSEGVRGGEEEQMPDEFVFQDEHIALIDLDSLFFELERFKAERGWYNLNLRRDSLPEVLCDQQWYRLQIPEEELEFDSYAKTKRWQEIALALLKKYLERLYTNSKSQWERPHLEYQTLREDDANMLVREGPGDSGYRILIDASEEEIVSKLTELKQAIESGKMKGLEFAGLKTLWFDGHLYQPLLHLEGNGKIEIQPAPMNKGESKFVEDLKKYHDGNPDTLEGKELYLLRNLSKGRGVGFFEAGNFHPDFILWLVEGEHQHVTFVDPKGIRNLAGGSQDPKIMFFETVKDIENRLGDPNTTLRSFIISNSWAGDMTKMWRLSKEEMESRNILFQRDDPSSYIGKMVGKICEVV